MGEINIHTDQLQVVPGLVGGYIFAVGLCSLVTKERLFLSETLLAMVYGIIVGPRVLNWMDPSEWSSNNLQLTQEFSRYALAIEVMIAGVSLPKKYVLKELVSLLMLLLPLMTIMWLISSAIIKFVFGLSFLHALAIGACVAPTDPVLANAILKGMFAETHVPLRLRNILTAESGANDGLVTVILVMLLRRLPALMASYKLIPAVRTWQDALFAGWFGPIGVSAIFYSVETIKQLEEHEDSNGGRVAEIVYPIVCAIVFGSVLVHGVTIPLVLMGKRVKTTISLSATNMRSQPSNPPPRYTFRGSFSNKDVQHDEKNSLQIDPPADPTPSARRGTIVIA
ncbi:hypothetical protein H4S08_002501 [Coemansia sp. RSA 1365]|nr:hypothetical protein H4S08_002501 [Coemansia sp. RSA 1365]